MCELQAQSGVTGGGAVCEDATARLPQASDTEVCSKAWQSYCSYHIVSYRRMQWEAQMLAHTSAMHHLAAALLLFSQGVSECTC